MRLISICQNSGMRVNGIRFTLKFGRTYWVILKSRRVANELLDGRAAIYSSRPNLPMVHSIILGEKRLLLMPYRDAWRRQRQVMHQVLNLSQQTIFKPFQGPESKASMLRLLDQPKTSCLSLGRFSNSVVMSVIFSHRPDPNDLILSAVLEVQEEFVKYMMPGASIVDTFPILAQIPLLKSWQP